MPHPPKRRKLSPRPVTPNRDPRPATSPSHNHLPPSSTTTANNLSVSPTQWDQCKHHTLRLLTRPPPSNPPPPHLRTQHSTLHTLLSNTILAGESNTALLIGPRGSGKSQTVEHILDALARRAPGTFHVVRLDGLLQSDERLALREIWRQLGRDLEPSPDGDGGDNNNATAVGGGEKNHADALAKLLALLSHEEPPPPDPPCPETVRQQPDRAEDLSPPSPPSGGGGGGGGPVTRAKSVIFLLSSFEAFTQHPRQTLLYNLFDTASSRKAPVAVLGCGTAVDATERLEKRVKSRFSGRVVVFGGGVGGVGGDGGEGGWEAWINCLRAYLHIPEHSHSHSEDEKAQEQRNPKTSPASDPTKHHWNTAISALLRAPPSSSSSPPALLHTLRRIYHTTRSLPEALTALYLPVYHLSPPPPPNKSSSSSSSSPHHPQHSAQPTLLPPTSNLHHIPHLATLSLTLLISAARVAALRDSDAVSFPLAYAEYTSLVKTTTQHSHSHYSTTAAAATTGGTRLWGREVARGAWEELVAAGLLVPESGNVALGVAAAGGGGGGGLGGEYYRCDVALEEIEGAATDNQDTAGGDGDDQDGEGTSAWESVMEGWCRRL